jgi:crotonobetainyl-CoA:carnitine CoA-transferase CaiB-like acyl-CoA transferase
VRHRDQLAERIERVTSTQPKAHWLAQFDRRGIPCGPINSYAEAFDDPQVRARGMVVELDHPAFGRHRTLGSPIKMSETPTRVERPAPQLGEHTREVLREAGLDEEAIVRTLSSRR